MKEAGSPFDPRLVLVAALVLPGCGQVINRRPLRGLTFLFFMLLLGGFTLKTASPDVSTIGKFLEVCSSTPCRYSTPTRMRGFVWSYGATEPAVLLKRWKKEAVSLLPSDPVAGFRRDGGTNTSGRDIAASYAPGSAATGTNLPPARHLPV